MSGAEYAVANATALAELRSSVGMAGTCLTWLLVVYLGGWLILGCIAAMKHLPLRKFALSIAILAVLLMSQMALAQSSRPVSGGRACIWSVGATLAPMVVGAGCLWASSGEGSDDFVVIGLCVGSAGLVFGPGAGHAYAKQWDRYRKGTTLRVLAGGACVGGLLLSSWDDETLAPLLFTAGALTTIVSAIHDIAAVGKSVDEYNHSHGFSDLRLSPTYFASQRAPGVMLTLSF